MNPYEKLNLTEIQVSFKPPGTFEEQRLAFRIDTRSTDAAFTPLDREHDLDAFMQFGLACIEGISPAQRALKQRRIRHHIIDDIAKQIARKIIYLVEGCDPKHGYTPEEWKALNNEHRSQHLS